MIGRAAYSHPWQFADADARFFGVPNPGLTRRAVIARYLEWMDAFLAGLPPDVRSSAAYRPPEFAKPLSALFAGEHGGAKFRATLNTEVVAHRLSVRDALALALPHISPAALDAPPGGPVPTPAPPADVPPPAGDAPAHPASL